MNVFDENTGLLFQNSDYPNIDEVYTLFSRIPLLIDENEIIYADDLWALDLKEHFAYIRDLRLCCPLRSVKTAPAGWTPIAELSPDRISRLREDHGWLAVLANLIPNFFATARAAKHTKIAHGGCAGWPFPLDYYLLFLKPFFGFKWIVVMESSFWLQPFGSRPTLRQRVSHRCNLFFSRACLRLADARIFTQAGYRSLMLGDDISRTLINEAVWVNEEDILSEDALTVRMQDRSGPVRILVPTRLIAEKGIRTILDAIALAEAHLTKSGVFPALIIDVIGAGAMEDEVRAFIAGHRGQAIKLSFLDPVPYGPAFFSLLGAYEAIIVANLTEEQPRIIYDAFSQGLPCIASRTTGVTQIAEDGRTSWLFAPGSAEDLAERLVQAANDRQGLAVMGARALSFVRDYTHRAMHKKRARFLADCLNP